MAQQQQKSQLSDSFARLLPTPRAPTKKHHPPTGAPTLAPPKTTTIRQRSIFGIARQSLGVVPRDFGGPRKRWLQYIDGARFVRLAFSPSNPAACKQAESLTESRVFFAAKCCIRAASESKWCCRRHEWLVLSEFLDRIKKKKKNQESSAAGHVQFGVSRKIQDCQENALKKVVMLQLLS